jgi:hypothetical protein
METNSTNVQEKVNAPIAGMQSYSQPFVLVGFEESQAITNELRAKGVNAFSCDLQDCSGGNPKFHLKMDIFQAINLRKWDMIILHPPCTHTALCGNRWYWNKQERIDGIELCKKAWEAAINVCDKVALEQPKTIMQKYIGQKSQVIHPWQFGHGETKETWLWLKGLPPLKPTNIVDGRENRIWKMPPSKDRQKLRSKTYPGIAKAISEQWL